MFVPSILEIERTCQINFLFEKKISFSERSMKPQMKGLKLVCLEELHLQNRPKSAL